LEFLEDHVRQGLWGVLLLSYEAAPVLNPSLVTYPVGDFPFAWAAVFDHPARTVPAAAGKFRISPWVPDLSKEAHSRAVRKIQSRIARGDTYQVNFTFPFRSRWTGEPWAWYRRLALAQGAPYSAFVDLGRWQVLSLSPELFFDRRGDLLTVRPMKGSAPRGRWEEEDRAFAKALRTSPKERAENVMIVDLLRNDLGKIARPGSVRTTGLFKMEPYPTLWQMTSEIKARLRPGVGLTGMVEALFPSGSVTGAPKRKTMEIIKKLETGPRGLYTGMLGLLRPDGHWTFNVAIRTLTLDMRTGRASCPVGSGITAASRPGAEYRECLLKSDFLNAPVFDLLETLRLEDGRWFLLPGHLRRLRRSAERMGFPWDEGRVRARLHKEAGHHPKDRWKVRLLLSRDGSVKIQAEKLEPTDAPWRVALARKPVDKGDLFLYHKTTRREIYDQQRRAHPLADDVILWNRRRELTESTWANLVLQIRGKRYTPPVPCGLLGGVFREHLLRRGQVTERILRLTDLRRAEKIFLVNSVRGWISVDFS
jgi:para-aminobenzoate synthetase/4-amino-4-deoxychorismate lyase